jgi:hypothetical protein
MKKRATILIYLLCATSCFAQRQRLDYDNQVESLFGNHIELYLTVDSTYKLIYKDSSYTIILMHKNGVNDLITYKNSFFNPEAIGLKSDGFDFSKQAVQILNYDHHYVTKTQNTLRLFYSSKKLAKKDFYKLLKQFENSIIPQALVKSETIDSKNVIKRHWLRFYDQQNDCFNTHTFGISLTNKPDQKFVSEIEIFYR